MSSYVDDYRPRRRDRAPYPDQMDDPRGRPPPGEVPPPPIGDTLRPAMKNDGSRSRISPETRPQFPEEASFLGSTAPDLERKTRPKDQRFRDMRDGYESDEGEMHRKARAGNGRRGASRDRGPRSDPRDRDRERDPYPPDNGRRRADPYDDRGPPPPRNKRRDSYYDEDYPPPRRGGGRPPPEIEYGSDPIPPSRRRSERRPNRRDYDDDSEDDYRPPRRRRSFDDHRRPYSDVRDDRGSKRRDRSQRRHDDYDDYDDRDRRDRRSSRPPKEIKIGKYDVGPWVEKGQKHWVTVAPILTPLVLRYASKLLAGDSKR